MASIEDFFKEFQYDAEEDKHNFNLLACDESSTFPVTNLNLYSNSNNNNNNNNKESNNLSYSHFDHSVSPPFTMTKSCPASNARGSRFQSSCVTGGDRSERRKISSEKYRKKKKQEEEILRIRVAQLEEENAALLGVIKELLRNNESQ